MIDTKMFIPQSIKVGYQNRKGTYTGKLAYVIYTDDKGKLRKEKSWQSWRDHKIKTDDLDNTPTSGFVLNKGVGGARQSYGWNVRNEYIRVYDPRNFEFEISVANLLFILQETSSIKGKGLEGEFVYAWNGTELVLLPVGSEEYVECVKHTERQKVKFDKKDMKEGYSYLMKDGTEVLYLGRHNYSYQSWKSEFNPVGKKHVFVPLQKPEYSDPYIVQDGFTKIAECTSSSSLPQYPDEYEKFKRSAYCGNITTITVDKTSWSDELNGTIILVKEGDKYYPAQASKRYNYYDSYRFQQNEKPYIPKLTNGTIKMPHISNKTNREIECTLKDLWGKDIYTINVVTEKGKKLRIG